MNHADVVEKAGWWLRERMRCCPVLLEPRYGSPAECPDAIGWRYGNSVVVEAKASRSDFLADKAKPHRKGGWGMGLRRYYMAPRGIVFPDEIPEGWGYLELRGKGTGRVHKILEAPLRDLAPEDVREEFKLLIGALANVQYRARGVILEDSRHAAANLGPNARAEYWRGYDEGREREKRGAGEVWRTPAFRLPPGA